ncbi:MAG: alkaline phosphatase family protein [Sphingobacteriaceae bacterium]
MKKHFSLLAVVLILALVCISCDSEKSDMQIPRPKLPKPDHIIIIIEENHGNEQIIGSMNAPYINQLAEKGALFTNSSALTHPSQPNYLGLFSGSTQGISGDECLLSKTPFTTKNLGLALLKAGYTFTGFSETLPQAGFTGCSYHEIPGNDYARKHAPWVNWQGNRKNNLPASSHQPLTNFPTDLSQLPTLSFVIPNEENDMHNPIGGDAVSILRADEWFKKHLSAYVDWSETHNSLLIFTFDEAQGSSLTHNRITTFFVGPMVKPGQYQEAINHYSVLRTIEAMYNLTPSGNAKQKAIADVWNKF